MYKRKRASLSISINAIVILILAITILGLGLGFIKKQFGSVEEQFTQVSSEIKNEMINKIKQSGDLLVMDRIEFEISQGKPEKFYIGVHNTDSDAACFNVKFECKSALTGICDAPEDGISGLEWFKTFEKQLVKPGETAVLPVTLLATGASDTYLAKVTSFKYDATDSGCGTGAITNWDDAGTEHNSKEFYVTLR